jgi:cytoskeletal protein CcmA (bactofilin family)
VPTDSQRSERIDANLDSPRFSSLLRRIQNEPKEIPVSIDRHGSERFEPSPALPSNLHNYVSNGTKLEGEIYFEGPTVIDGCAEGELTTNSSLFIGENAEVNATIQGASIIIAGKVTGKIAASERIELCSTAKVSGSMTSTSLVIHEGAWLEGDCSVKAVPVLKVPETGTAESDDLSAAKISFFITVKQKVELRAKGYDEAAIGRMTPADAHKILGITY